MTEKVSTSARDHLLMRAAQMDEHQHAWSGRWTLAVSAGNAVALLSSLTALLDMAQSKADPAAALVGGLLIGGLCFFVGLCAAALQMRSQSRLSREVRNRHLIASGVAELQPDKGPDGVEADRAKFQSDIILWRYLSGGGFVAGGVAVFVGLVLTFAW